MNILAKTIGSLFAILMLPILIFAYICLAVGLWVESIVSVWTDK